MPAASSAFVGERQRRYRLTAALLDASRTGPASADSDDARSSQILLWGPYNHRIAQQPDTHPENIQWPRMSNPGDDWRSVHMAGGLLALTESSGGGVLQ